MNAGRLAGTVLGCLGAFVVATGLPSRGHETSASELPYRTYLAQVSSDAPAAVTGFTVHFLDVGQGDATLITVNGQRLLIDGGRTQNLALQRLQALGVTDLDAIVATHPDADHVGGLASVLAAFPVERIYVNGDPSDTQTYSDFLAAASAETGAVVSTLGRGLEVTLGGLHLPVLSPGPLTGDTNNDSIVLRLSCGSVSVQFEGDAEQAAEQAMIAAGVLLDVNILKVGHHGSNTASSPAFLAAVKPETAVISAGLNNQFGHPHSEVIARLNAIGAAIVSTDTTSGDDTKLLASNCSTYTFTTVGTGGPVPTTTPTRTSTPAPASPSASATPTPTATKTPSATATIGGGCGGTTATITALDKVGEVVTLSVSGNMTGWSIVSLTGSQTFNFPNGFVGSGTVQVKSATAQFPNTTNMLWWSAANLWNNSANDDAQLRNCNGQAVQTFDDGD